MRVLLALLFAACCFACSKSSALETAPHDAQAQRPHMKLPNDAIGDALQRLVDDGSDLSQPMAMDFFLAVPDRGAAETIEPDVQKLGFETSISEEEG